MAWDGFGVSFLCSGVAKCLGKTPQAVRLPRKPPSNIQYRHIEPIIPLRHLEQRLAIPQRHLVLRRIPTAAPHVERHPRHVHPTPSRLREQHRPVLRRRPELARQPALTSRIVRDDAHDQPYPPGHGRALLHLGDVIERHEPYAATYRVDDVSPPLARIGIHDLRPGDVGGQRSHYGMHELDLVPGCAVEVAAEAHERPDDGRVGIALDGVVGYDAGEGRAPLRELRGDDAQVDDVERILDGVLHSRLEGGGVPLGGGRRCGG
mmetsp:Transcript_10438/g.25623  ORF Transcript_10438/g.25623 Transcript_10438/m.25623 type:complete len:263 (+) Transcript_10438:1855-2643(+)